MKMEGMDISTGKWEKLNFDAPRLREAPSCFVYHNKVCFLSENFFTVLDLETNTSETRTVFFNKIFFFYF